MTIFMKGNGWMENLKEKEKFITPLETIWKESFMKAIHVELLEYFIPMEVILKGK